MRRTIGAALLLAAGACSKSAPLGDGLPARIDCASCHGDATSPAPPRGVHGEGAPSEVAVGAHRLHLGDNLVRSAVACADCHVVPATVDAPGHVDAPHATVTFSALARGPAGPGALSPAWNREDATCAQVWCHGAGLAGGTVPAPRWTFFVAPDPGRPGICGTCHGAPPPRPHPQLGPCAACHPTTVRSDGTIDIAGGHHVNGVVEADPAAAACGACHAVPGTSGAHAVHHAASPAAPVASYGDLRVWADYPPTACRATSTAAGTATRSTPSGTWTGPSTSSSSRAARRRRRSRRGTRPVPAMRQDGTCSGVACHSSGQEAPAYRTTPSWGSGTKLACDGCHGMPPRYASGPAGSATANTHLVPRSTTNLGTVYTGAYGHFAWHNRTRTFYTQWISGQHGVTDSTTGTEVADGTFGAAPMTCQTCHFETVDPAATGPSGFWWLNTTGNYLADGQNYAGFGCATTNCHDDQPSRAPAGSGGVLPRRHVNGSRDVSFDPRTATTSYRAPVAPAAPTFPYWITVVEFKDANHLPPGSAFSPSPPPPDGTAAAGTLSFELTGATYDPLTKTCGTVACHLAQASVQWGGTGLGTLSTCFGCHSIH